MYACETCPSEFSCGGLATALKVAEALPNLKDRKALYAVVTDIRSRLVAAGWDHLDSAHLCKLAGKDHEIQNLTARLIAELQESRRHFKDQDINESEQPSLLAEERCCE